MESQPPSQPAVSEQSRGLPPVTPPSGRFIAQLFLVPGTIVFIAVLLMLAFSNLLGGSQDPAGYLKQLDSDNTGVRWRGASDLAQVLKRPESMNLKTNATFALDLAQRLRTGLDDLNQEEKRVQDKTAQGSAQAKEAAWGKPLDAKRDYVSFLAAAIGDFYVPVGVPLLSEMVLRAESPDPRNILRRRQALGSLCNLGNNLKEFDKLPKEKKAEIMDLLVKETAGKESPRTDFARHGLYYLDRAKLSAEKESSIVMVDATLAKVAEDQDQYLREWVALAFNFWDGPLAEPTLQKLGRDKGQGTTVRFRD
jgi:hypothetical protein